MLPRTPIRQFLFLSLSVCMLTGQSKPSDSELAGQIKEYMRRIARFGFHGSILVAKDGRILVQEGYGMADRDAQLLFTANTYVETGSITKQFTAAGILKLEMQGKLKVTDSISRFFSDVPEDKRTITLHHLLTHTSGLQSNFGDDYEPMTRQQIIRAALGSKLQTPPGTEYSYSNAGYSLLGAIIELVSGQPYDAFLREQLFKPAGMVETGYKLPKWDPKRVPHGYENDRDWGTMFDKLWADDGPYWNLRANGGIISSLSDLYRWHLALQGDNILSASAKQKLFAPHVVDGDGHYGYGWGIRKGITGTRLITHGGSNGIYHARFSRFVDDDLVIIAFSNVAGMFSEFPARTVERILYRQEYVEPPNVSESGKPGMRPVAGTYRAPSGATMTVSRSTSQLSVVADGQEAYGAIASSRSGDPKQLEQLNARVNEIVRGIRSDDYKPLHAAFGDDRSLDEVAKSSREFWAEEEQARGPLRSGKVLGTGQRRTSASTLVEFEFEKGKTYYEYIWRDGKLVAIQPIASPVRTFLPLPDGSFGTFDLRSDAVAHLSFAREKHGNWIMIQSKGGAVRAVMPVAETRK
ncbi:MAG: beta-lactamase family protein [Acidobacteriales bacterium]|nr:beta-lactamase family protein [Terriglobales bacterium]